MLRHGHAFRRASIVLLVECLCFLGEAMMCTSRAFWLSILGGGGRSRNGCACVRASIARVSGFGTAIFSNSAQGSDLLKAGSR